MKHRRGFTLLEAMITLFVLTTGLLGAAALLLDSLRHHHQALRQAAANLLVADMLERIRANTTARAHYDSRAASATSPCDDPAPCNPAQRAAADLAHFSAAADQALPGRQPRIAVYFEPAIAPATPDLFRIVLRWRESRDSDASETVSLVLMSPGPVAGA